MKLELFVLAGVAALSFATDAFAQPAGVGAIEVSDKVISVSGFGYHRVDADRKLTHLQGVC
ncbi:hypothetical protein [Massilia sp. TWP1-3-3]|uniref:hypothetical protein n=1 Tax=Massilia sp. TWP1-3-3 TaxID=2804573 RepID=UPI003CF04BE2